MIKLIASDVDGTLVKDSSPEIYPEIFPVLSALKEKGVILAIASGRQYPSIERMFEPVKNDIIMIAENGAHVRCRDTDMSITRMDKQDALSIVRGLKEYENVEVIVSCPGVIYLERGNPQFADLIFNQYRVNASFIDDLTEIKEDIIKLAAYRKEGIRQLGEEEIIPRFSGLCRCFSSGNDWVDFIDYKTDKGNALEKVMDFFHIKREEAAAFGDNANDLGMLEAVEESYCVDTSPDEIKRRVKHICPGYREKGVLQVLTEILNGL